MLTVTKEIKDFCERVGITTEQYAGYEPINGILNLDGVYGIPAHFTPRVNHSLPLNHITYVGEGFAPSIAGDLHLNGLTAIMPGFAPHVEGSLYLDRVLYIMPGFAPVVVYSLYLNSISTLPGDFNPIVGHNLYLNGLTSTPVDFCLSVGRSLFLNGVKHFGAGFAPSVASCLFINGNATMGPGFAPRVGEHINSSLILKGEKLDQTRPLQWGDGKYIQADGLLAEVIHQEEKNVWRVKPVGCDWMAFLVTDGKGNFAFDSELDDAWENLESKVSSGTSKPSLHEVVFCVNE